MSDNDKFRDRLDITSATHLQCRYSIDRHRK